MRRRRDWKKPTSKADAAPEPSPQRLQKFLAARGLGSRREIEKWIVEGRITIDRCRARIGQKIRGDESIQLDGRTLETADRGPPRPRVIAYHKPEGEIVSRFDPCFATTVFGNLPALRNARWISVGRLDVNSQGLLLLTTDGELAHRLTHPSYAVEREYAVRVLGKVDDAMLGQLRKGVELDDGPAKFERVEPAGGEGANRWYRVSLNEGRNREVRRLWEAVGVRVSRLIRVRYGCIMLPRVLRPGKSQQLEAAARDELYELVGLTPPKDVSPRRAKPGRRRGGPSGKHRRSS